MKQEYLLSKANKYDRSEANMKIIKRIPTPSDQIDKEVDKLFNPKLNKFLSLSFVCICASGWLLILLAIFSS